MTVNTKKGIFYSLFNIFYPIFLIPFLQCISSSLINFKMLLLIDVPYIFDPVFACIDEIVHKESYDRCGKTIVDSFSSFVPDYLSWVLRGYSNTCWRVFLLLARLCCYCLCCWGQFIEVVSPPLLNLRWPLLDPIF